jgi:hypothetical protein
MVNRLVGRIRQNGPGTKRTQGLNMQMLLSATTILVLFAWAQEEVAKLPPAWSPFSAIEAAVQP